MLISPPLLHLFLCLIFLTTTAVGQPRREECGTVVTDDEKTEMEKAVAAVNLNHKRQTGDVKNYDFGIYFNVVAANMTVEGGWIPQKQIDDQISLMNTRYEGTGIRFHLLNVTRILSRNWHETVGPSTTAGSDMQRLFHKGGSVHLSVYTVGFYTDSLNGYSTLPVTYRTRPSQDGIVLLFTTLPGGTSLERQGGTLIHEAGHWLGLRHTFEGGCATPGDGVADTTPEAEAAYGCPIGRKSCPESDTVDPIHNFMDYTDESCRTEFTRGQIDLMQRSILTYRGDPNF